MSKNKFEHLDSQISPESIENTPIHLLDEERLPESKVYFENIKEKHSSNIEILNAANNIIIKIEKIINLGNIDFSGEIMKAANNPNYGIKKQVV